MLINVVTANEEIGDVLRSFEYDIQAMFDHMFVILKIIGHVQNMSSPGSTK